MRGWPKFGAIGKVGRPLWAQDRVPIAGAEGSATQTPSSQSVIIWSPAPRVLCYESWAVCAAESRRRRAERGVQRREWAHGQPRAR